MSNYARLKPCRFGFACGISWGLAVLILGIVAWRVQLGVQLVQVLGSLYKGYTMTWVGSLIGGGWAFLNALVGGFILAVVYNCCCGCKSSCNNSSSF